MDKSDLKIVFLGTPDFAVESLDRLHTEGYNIVGVVTMPDKPAGRGHKTLHSPVKHYAEAHGLHLMQPANLKDPEFVEHLRSLGADLFIVIAFRMLPEVVWRMPRLGTFNLHASLLPRYRGAAPINWAVINGDTETGVTTFMLKHEIDTGDILRQERIDILPEDNVGTVHDKLMHLGAELTLDTVRHILAEDLRPIPQDELLQGETPTPAPKIFKDTCRIDWSRPARDIHNLVRGLSPYPAAWTELLSDGAEPLSVKVFETAVVVENTSDDGSGRGRPSSQSKAAPSSLSKAALSPQSVDATHSQSSAGTVNITDGRMLVNTGDGVIEILSLQPQGKKRMATADFLRGARLTTPRFQ